MKNNWFTMLFSLTLYDFLVALSFKKKQSTIFFCITMCLNLLVALILPQDKKIVREFQITLPSGLTITNVLPFVLQNITYPNYYKSIASEYQVITDPPALGRLKFYYQRPANISDKVDNALFTKNLVLSFKTSLIQGSFYQLFLQEQTIPLKELTKKINLLEENISNFNKYSVKLSTGLPINAYPNNYLDWIDDKTILSFYHREILDLESVKEDSLLHSLQAAQLKSILENSFRSKEFIYSEFKNTLNSLSNQNLSTEYLEKVKLLNNFQVEKLVFEKPIMITQQPLKLYRRITFAFMISILLTLIFTSAYYFKEKFGYLKK